MEYDTDGIAKLLNKSKEEIQPIITDLLLSGLVEKNGDMFKLTELGTNFIEFITDPAD